MRIALETGYRHIDTARMYGNETAVGRGIAAADVDRESVFLGTKLWTDELGYDDVFEATAESLGRLGTDYLDILYIHWPAGNYDPESTLAAFEELYQDGIIERIGVSNFEPRQLEAARDVLGAPISANQIEIHPLLPQRRLREYCRSVGIELVAYSPLAKGEVFGIDVLSAIAADHGVSEAQVSLAWLRQRGLAAIPKAAGGEHIRENWASLELELSDAELERIEVIGDERRLVDPDFAPNAW